MLSAGSRSIRVPLVHSRKFPRLGRTIMKSVRAICTRSSSSRDSSSSRVTILRAFEIVNTIFREMKWNRKMKNRDRLEFSRSSKIPNSYFCYDENLLKLKEGVIKCNFDRMGEIILGIGIFCNVICDNFEISLL